MSWWLVEERTSDKPGAAVVKDGWFQGDTAEDAVFGYQHEHGRDRDLCFWVWPAHGDKETGLAVSAAAEPVLKERC